MIRRAEVLEHIHSILREQKHIIGISTASGLVVREAQNYRAGFVLVSASGVYRNMGRSALGAFLPYADCNELTREEGRKILSLQRYLKIKEKQKNETDAGLQMVPVLFGLNASDPKISLESYIAELLEDGYAGINNWPSLGMLDGSFGEYVNAQSWSYDREAEAIAIAHRMDAFTVAYVFTPEQAKKMAEAGADVICSHLGLTKGGNTANISSGSIHRGIDLTRKIFQTAAEINPEVIRMIYSGPVVFRSDLQYMYHNVDIDGYIGGSAFDRIPIEDSIREAILELKNGMAHGNAEDAEIPRDKDYVRQADAYIRSNIACKFAVTDIADALGISRKKLGAAFREEMGVTVSSYLIDTRMNLACSLLEHGNLPLYEVAARVGYGDDYAHFSKTFKKKFGRTPKDYQKMLRRKKPQDAANNA